MLTAEWVRQWRARPGGIVLIDSPSGDSWSASRLEEVTAGLATQLAEDGITAADRVALACRPSAAAALSAIAILRLGAAIIPLNPATTPAEIHHVIATVQPTLAIVDDLADLAAAARWDAVSTTDLAAICSRRAEAGEPVDRVRLDRSGPEQLAMICFTSGTTGPPKAVPHTSASLLAGTLALIEAWDWTSKDILVSALPLFHVHGLVVALFSTMTAGAAIIIQQRFDPELVAKNVLEHNATMVFGVPTMWWRIAEAGVAPQLHKLRLAVSGSARLDPVLSERLSKSIGQVPVERYGMSETLILTSNPVRGPRKPGGVGIPLPGVRLRVAADGVVEATGPTVFQGYLRHGTAERQRDGFTEDGWFRTGDLGHFDADGHLFLAGRASETLITGGHNVAPAEVEQLLLAQAGVHDVAVAGLPDAQWGQVIAAFIVGDPAEVSIAQLEAACLASLSDYKRPRIWKFVQTLPRNPMGKLDRLELARLAHDSGR